METTRVTTTDKDVDSFETDLLVYLATQIKKKTPQCDKAVMAQVKKAQCQTGTGPGAWKNQV